MMTTANWITIISLLVVCAVPIGVGLWRVGRLESDVKAMREQVDKALTALHEKLDDKLAEIQAGRERQGERLGDVEYDQGRILLRLEMMPEPAKRRRRTTKAIGEPVG
jgi:hypothetical protein